MVVAPFKAEKESSLARGLRLQVRVTVFDKTFVHPAASVTVTV